MLVISKQNYVNFIYFFFYYTSIDVSTLIINNSLALIISNTWGYRHMSSTINAL